MAHFAKISEDNKVLAVLAFNDKDMLDENGNPSQEVGQKYLEKHNHWPAHLWIQTSYNTYSNVHRFGKTPLHGNYAGIGMDWDPINKFFIGKKPYPSWVKHVPTASWKSPIGDAPAITVEMETNQQCYKWNEDSQSWVISSII